MSIGWLIEVLTAARIEDEYVSLRRQRAVDLALQRVELQPQPQ